MIVQPIDLEHVPESARTVLRHLSHLLANGFTGKILLDCNQGGVTHVTKTLRETAADLTSDS